jgi:SAM-dependent methyltransferase
MARPDYILAPPMNVDLHALSPALQKDDRGIWRARSAAQHTLSYPETGHAACFELEDASFWFAHRNACIAAALARHHVVGPFLDVGGGNGAVSHALSQRGIETVLLEPGHVGAGNARRRGLANVVCATLGDAGFADGSFPAAGAFDVIEHVADDYGLLREIHRVLAPGGRLCVTVPAHRWLWSAEDDLAEHHRRYTVPELRETLSRAGYEVTYATYFFALLTAPMFLLRSVPYRLTRGGAERSADEVEKGALGQHVPSRAVRRAVDVLLGPEVRRIEDGRTIALGTSCLAVATRR